MTQETSDSGDLSTQVINHKALAEAICIKLRTEITKLGFAESDIKYYPKYAEANYELIKDPYTGDFNLCCYWYDDTHKNRIGRLHFNSDGTFYADYDVVKTHPVKSKWFVEGVTAWGRPDNIKAEAKLLEMPA